MSAWRKHSVAFALRAGTRIAVAGLFLIGAHDALQNAIAEGDTRTLSFRHLHTDESLTVTFKRNGRYDEAALKQLNWFLRDWRRDEQIRMEPHLFDILWETYREVGGTQPIEIISAYRSPATNAMLRARSSGVAETSRHTSGQAIDFHIPGVPLEKVRNAGLRLQRGGVGFYPTSGSPFVHMDVGSVRHWPRMTHEQLAKVFPDGRTVHIPSDGQPLPGYALALADVERRGSRPSGVSLEAARDAGVIATASAEQTSKPRKGLLDGLFGGFAGNPEPEETNEPAVAPKRTRQTAPVAVASATPAKPVAVAAIAPPTPVAVEPILPPEKPVVAAAVAAPAVPLPVARPKVKAAPPPIVVASLPGNLFDTRGYWRGSVDATELPPAKSAPFEVASADPSVTGSAAFAYAAESGPERPARARPMGASIPKLPREGSVTPALANNSRMIEKPMSPAMAAIADNPWLRAAILTPNIGYMSVSRLGAFEPRVAQELMHKPAQAVVMTFSADPHLGMEAEYFSGSAVVFLATATFTPRQSAALK